MTFLLEFDLLMIGVCTFIQKNKKTKKQKKKQKEKKTKKRTKKKKKKSAKICLCLISYSIDFFVVGFIIGGLSEIFMRDELCESSLRSFVPWIMTDKECKDMFVSHILLHRFFCCWVHHWGFE